MSLRQLCSDIRNSWATIRCESLKCDGDIESNSVISDVIGAVVVDVADTLDISGNGVIEFPDVNTGIRRIIGNPSVQYTFVPEAGSRATGDIQVRVSEIGNTVVMAITITTRALTGAGAICRWDAPVGFPTRFHPFEPEVNQIVYLTVNGATSIGMIRFNNANQISLFNAPIAGIPANFALNDVVGLIGGVSQTITLCYHS